MMIAPDSEHYTAEEVAAMQRLIVFQWFRVFARVMVVALAMRPGEMPNGGYAPAAASVTLGFFAGFYFGLGASSRFQFGFTKTSGALSPVEATVVSLGWLQVVYGRWQMPDVDFAVAVW